MTIIIDNHKVWIIINLHKKAWGDRAENYILAYTYY